MRLRFPSPCGALLGLAFSALVIAACSGGAPPAVQQSGTASPNPVNQLSLTMLRVPVQHAAASGASTDLVSDDSVNLGAGDRINVGDKGRALLKFGDQLAVELMDGTQVEVRGVWPDPRGSALVELKQIAGPTNIQLQGPTQARLVVTTDDATITPGGQNPQVLVCRTSGVLTCVIAVNGDVQLQAKDQTVTLRAGEASYVLPGQAPQQPICAHLREVRLWLQQARGGGEAGDLGSLVVNWPQRPCTPSAAAGAGEGNGAGGGIGTGGGNGAGGGAGAVAEANQLTPAAPPAAPTPTEAAPVRPTAIPTGAPSPTPTFTVVPTPVPTATPAATATEPPTATPAPYGPATAAPAPARDMVRIEAGKYVIGAHDTDDYHIAVREVTLPEFWIDQYNVTNAQYQSFLKATGHPAPPTWAGGAFPGGHEAHPAAGLSWDDAAAYCAWAGKRLPSEAEWEVAGRGPGADPALYPWGTDPTANGQVDPMPERDTYPAGAFAFNKSPFGVYDMIGTVWQWVGEPYAPVPSGLKVLRGGRHGLLEDLAYRQAAKPDDERFARVAGVRCAADRVAGE